MIIKQYNLKKDIINEIQIFLLYGPNEGLIEEVIENILKPNISKNVHSYDENEILANIDRFKESIFNKSFFETDKLIIVNRVTDKFLFIIKEIIEKKIVDLKIIMKSGLLEKRSKLRNFFEKNNNNNTAITPFYDDNFQSLFSLAQNFIKINNIKISSQNINLIIERSGGSRIAVKNELEKILFYSQKKTLLDYNDILKLTNRSENLEISELTDQFLMKNKKKTLNMLNENILSGDENVTIIRNFLYKLKRLKKIKEELRNKKIDDVLSDYKPIIFWKDKDILKQQLKVCSISDINFLIKKVNNLELMVKKNAQLSNQILSDFIMDRFEISSS